MLTTIRDDAMAKRKPCPSNYLQARESFMVARGVHARLHEQLTKALSVNTEAELSIALLNVDGAHPLAGLVEDWRKAEAALDQAEKTYDAARANVAQRIVEADLASIDC